ncbi:Alpha/Beta hydrolase protein [Phellopilus nigrolimitatus]|nr:Alpha/Beta hydrolase protein [Phellopilus nigrolimitatus]
MAQWAHYSAKSEEWLQILAQHPEVSLMAKLPPSVTDGTESELTWRKRICVELPRQSVEAAGAPVGITVKEPLVPVSNPSGEIAVRVYTPESQDSGETFPAFLNIHGGGYCFFTLDVNEIKCREFCSTYRAVIVSVEYRLAPEYKWPVGLNDTYTALKWLASNAPSLCIDPKKGLIVSGASAGANFACTVAQRARGDPELKGKITGQLLQVPQTCWRNVDQGYPEKYKDQLLSFDQNKDDPILHPALFKLFMDAYPGPSTDPEMSPLLAETLAGLPPAYMQVAGGDPLRDEGLLYAQRLEEDGVPTKIDIYPGMPHGFDTNFPQLSASAKWRADLESGVRWLLELAGKAHS